MSTLDLTEQAATADRYAQRAEAQGTYLGESADFWRGAAATYRLLSN
jgi:hypothetical protein